MIDRDEKLTEAIRCIIECSSQGGHDFCGDQRKFHLPRLTTAMANLVMLFPSNGLEAMETAKDPWGELICKEDPE